LHKIIALDIGGKRTGIAETDPLQIIASPKATVPTAELLAYLIKWLPQEEVEILVLGYPLNLDGTPTHNTQRVLNWHKRLAKHFLNLEIVLHDERYTSKMAAKALVQSGVKKKKRQQKGSLDAISAALILEDYLKNTKS
jgi:putative Holliday junction resolvase